MKYFLGMLMMTLSLTIGTNVGALDNTDEALETFKKGKTFFKDGEFAQAADAFRRANELNPNWKLQYNIAQSEAAAKRYGLSLEAFEKYLSEGGDEVKARRQKEVVEEIERLRRMVGFLTVNAPEGAIVSVDGIERGVAPINRELPVASSVNHDVTATVSGEIVAKQSIQVNGGRTSSIELGTSVEPIIGEESASALDASEGEKEPEEALDVERSELKTWGWISLGLGGALLVGGGVTGGLALSAKGDVEQACPDGCYSDDYGLIDKRDNLALTTDILLGVGGVAAVSGIIMLIVDAKGEDSKETNITLLPSPGGFNLVGRF